MSHSSNHFNLSKLNLASFVKYDTIKDNGKITDLRITQVDLPAIVELLYERVDPKNNLKDPIIHQQFNILGQEQKLILASQMLITRYCIHRILTHFKLYQAVNWEYAVGADYYGEEINSITIKTQLANQIAAMLESLRVRNVTEKLEIILKLEYGRLIPSIVKKKWYVRQVSVDDLYYSNQEHYEQCLQDINCQRDENDGSELLEEELAQLLSEKEVLEDNNEELELRRKLEELRRHQEELKRKQEYRKVLEEYPYPRAITILNPDGKYKVIDGYHRLVGTPEGINPLVIYCLRDE